VTYELDFPSDEILKLNSFKPFHEAAENVDKSMTQWKEEYDLIIQKQGNNTGAQVTDISTTLTTAMDQIPQMTERKKKIDMHVQIATKILAEIKRRQIDKLQDFEDELMTTGRISSANKVEFSNYFKRETDKVDEYNDKIRLLIIYIICGADS
jgi:sec1 family domain-containing protein 1